MNCGVEDLTQNLPSLTKSTSLTLWGHRLSKKLCIFGLKKSGVIAWPAYGRCEINGVSDLTLDRRSTSS